ncbi:hypothetical protein M2168_006316 [Streptomyces sp. CZ24]|nr:hypothetical protein [Streptomyces sp. CZ24]
MGLLSKSRIVVGPAPAGMLPARALRRRGTPRRPRTRGDAPRPGPPPSSGARSAPHPRGCSHLTASLPANDTVGPAPAGMLRCPRPSATRTAGRPRTRGDAPTLRPAPTGPRASAPHPRGCTSSMRPLLVMGPVAPHPRGCSGRGGVRGPGPRVVPHPRGCSRHRCPARVPDRRRPRTRGDAPIGITCSVTLPRSAPHPRGCSVDLPAHHARRPVGPAPAGMLRAVRAVRRRRARRPRIRGDAPFTFSHSTATPVSAPHPRGCSPAAPRAPLHHFVGPAPAGMLRAAWTRRVAWSSRPRTRGDAPGFSAVGPVFQKSPRHPRGCSVEDPPEPRRYVVGPAPAGMLRPATPTPAARAGRPRARGDAPTVVARGMWAAQSAPRPRGCSAQALVELEGPEVGPAPAGMLRPPGGRGPAWCRRPRTRGDAPGSSFTFRVLDGPAPQQRGCSVPETAAPLLRRVGPAPAGMLSVRAGRRAQREVGPAPAEAPRYLRRGSRATTCPLRASGGTPLMPCPRTTTPSPA